MMSKSEKTRAGAAYRSRYLSCPCTLRLLLVLLLLLLIVGCRRDMQDQPKVKPLRGSTFFTDGLGSRQPIEGTIPRGYLRSDTAFFTGKKTGLSSTPGASPTPGTPQPTASGKFPCRTAGPSSLTFAHCNSASRIPMLRPARRPRRQRRQQHHPQKPEDHNDSIIQSSKHV
jgi:hypothetical protein